MPSARPLAEPLERRRLLAVGTLSEQIIVDQFGWRADAARKVVVFADPQQGQNAAVSYTPGATFQVRRADNDAVAFTGSVAAWRGGQTHGVSGDKVWHGDFAALRTPGEYYVYDATSNRRSFPFRLDNHLFNPVLKTSVRTYYYQRAGFGIDAAHGGKWTHAPGHVGPNQDHAARLWNNGGPVAGTARDVWGGWYDAGDYNKFVPFTTGVVWNLLTAYGWNPAAFADDWNIPESGNGVPDLVDELKFELDWLLRMQRPDGAVHNRVANSDYNSGRNDPSTDTQARFYTQPTTWATASFAASAAHASRVFAAFESRYAGYAARLRDAAEDAWAYLQPRPEMFPANGLDGGGTGGTGTGGLAAVEAGSDANGDRRVRLLAAAELFKTTGAANYKSYFDANYRNANLSGNGFHPLLASPPHFDASVAGEVNRALVTYATAPGASSAIVNEIKAALANNLDESWLALGQYEANADPYRAFMWDGHYTWGSNQLKAEWANILLFAVKLGAGTTAQRTKALEAAEEYVHYLHGRNPLSWVYLSNMGPKGAKLGGDKSPTQVYHSWFGDGSPLYDGANSTHGPVPGYLVGGPNQYFSVTSISPPSGEPPMKAYRDWNTGWPEASWEITEPAIYYQAAYTLLLSQFATAGAGPPPSQVVGRHVFYNNSVFDTAGSDDAAIATDKRALLPGGGAATFANYTSYSRGINGIMVDVAGLPADATLAAGDFEFRTGNDDAPAGWATPSAQPLVTARPGPGGARRVTLVWPDGAIRKTWLQVTVKANANTRLAAPDVFYFGNAVGESGNSTSDAVVNFADESGARAHPRTMLDPAPIDYRWDYDRDFRVDPRDQLIARANKTTSATALRLITPASGGAAVAAAAAARPVVKPVNLFAAEQAGAPVGRRDADADATSS